MSTRGCIVELKKEKCRIGYIHYGLDFLCNLFHKNSASLTDDELEQKMQEAKERWDIYRETTDKEIIEQLYNYNKDIIKMDAAIFIFVEDKGRYKDITIRYFT